LLGFRLSLQGELFGRELPRVAVPTNFSKRWVSGIPNGPPGAKCLTGPAAW
jgi:hypothetical protein